MLQPNGLVALERLGVLEQVLEAGHRITRVKQLDESGRVRAQASYEELEHPHPYLVVIRRADAIAILARRLPESVNLRFACSVTGLTFKSGRVEGLRYVDGDGGEHELPAGLVVGADGIGSSIRKGMAVRESWRTGPDRYLIGIAPSPPEDDAAVLVCGRGWCNGLLPLGDRTYFFDHVTDDNRDPVERGDFDAWREIYARRVPGGERIVAGLKSFDELGSLSGRTHRATPRARPGVALLGDAAAAVHPHNGQGANLALEDAVVLGAALADHGSGEATLQRYARIRDAKLRRAVRWSIFIGRTLDGPNLAWRANRRVGYLVSRLPPVRRMTTRRQAGLA